MGVVTLDQLPERVVLTVVDGGPVRCDLVANWLASLRRIGLGDEAVVVSMDQDATAALASLDVPVVEPWPADAGQKRAVLEYGSAAWTEVIWKKLEGIHHVLASGRRVLYTDPDVVFLRDPLAHLDGLGVEVCAQSDAPPTEPIESSAWPLRLEAALGRVIPFHWIEALVGMPETDRRQGRLADFLAGKLAGWIWPGWRRSRHTICAGVLYLHPKPRVIRVFDPARGHGTFAHDQTLLHHRLVLRREARCAVLDAAGFPNGHVLSHRLWQHGRRALDDAYLAHINWCVGEEKLARMRELDLWHLP